MEINNGKVFLEDMEDSSCTDTSSQSVNLPEHLSPLYQLKAESSIESSSMSTSTNVQQSQSTNQQSPQVIFQKIYQQNYLQPQLHKLSVKFF